MDLQTLDFDTEIACFTDKQLEAVAALDSGKVKYLLWGGALGGGKSRFLRWWALRRLLQLGQRGLKNVTGMIACENYPALKDRQLQKIAVEFPPEYGKMHQDHKDYGRAFVLDEAFGGGAICFRNLDDPAKYASSEFAFIGVDELTKNDYDVFTFLRTRLRWPGLTDMETHFVGATNPGSKGHVWTKQLWIDKIFPEEWRNPRDYTHTFHYIPSRATDNPHLDPGYWAMLETLPEHIRKAFQEGSWDIFVGQAFSFTRETHCVPCREIPEGAPLYMTYDWGFGAPFAIYWAWIDADGRIHIFDEMYGWNGNPNQGLRKTDEEVAQMVIDRERALGIWGQPVTRITGHDSFQKRPNYFSGGGQGPSTSEVFATKGLFLQVGDPNRALKIRAFRERLKMPKDGTLPMLVVDPSCEQFIRTVPALVTDPNNVEDVDTKGEDHCYDAVSLLCMARAQPHKVMETRTLTPAQRDWQIIRGEVETNNAVNVDGYGI